MSDLLISELLILTSLLPVVLRFVFIRSHRVDSVVLISPMAFIVSILLWFVYGLSFSLLCVTTLALIILISNFRALLRYFDKLFVDYYSIKFRIATFLEAIALVLLAIILFYFRPYPVKEHSVQVFSGSCTRGFIERKEFLQSANLFLTKFEKDDISSSLFTPKKRILYPLQDNEINTNKIPVILYIPQLYSSTYDVSPRLEALAQNGYTVICAEFYTDDIKLFGNNFDLRIFRSFFARRLEPKDDFSEERAIQKKALIKLVTAKYENVYFYEPNINEVTPLKEDFYLMRPLEAWMQDYKNYHNLRAKAECVPRMVVLDVTEKLGILTGFED